ncbi:HK97 gp10 family phage protein, partial [Anaerococcus vaginalis]
MNVKIENLASEIMKGLEEYSDMATDEVKKEVKKAGSNIRKDIQENAPVGETKKYSKSWSVKTMKETSNSIELVVHSRNR